MKHQKSGRQFGRVRSQRTALFRILVGNLIMHEKIETTQAKAKELKTIIDRIITRAKRANGDQMQLVRKLEADVPLIAIKKLSGGFLKNFDKRDSGYTRVIKLVARRSDASPMAIITFVDSTKAQESVKTEKKEEKKSSAKKATAKKVTQKKQEAKEEITA